MNACRTTALGKEGLELREGNSKGHITKDHTAVIRLGTAKAITTSKGLYKVPDNLVTKEISYDGWYLDDFGTKKQLDEVVLEVVKSMSVGQKFLKVVAGTKEIHHIELLAIQGSEVLQTQGPTSSLIIEPETSAKQSVVGNEKNDWTVDSEEETDDGLKLELLLTNLRLDRGKNTQQWVAKTILGPESSEAICCNCQEHGTWVKDCGGCGHSLCKNGCEVIKNYRPEYDSIRE